LKKVKVLNKIALKAIFTEELRKKMQGELDNLLKEIDMEIEQLDFQNKRLLSSMDKANPQQRLDMKQNLNQKKENKLAEQERIKQRLKELEEMEYGDEVLQGNLNGVVEVQVGDLLEEKLVQEIVTKDGRVIEIR